MPSIHNELEHINAAAREDPGRLVARSEARYGGIVAEIARRALGVKGHKLILLAGPSASGKTTTALKLAQAMGEAGVRAHRISLDDFYLEAGNLPLLPDGNPDIESVHALDLPLLRGTLRSLMESGCGEIPHFKFAEGRRARWDSLCLGKDDLIVLEGLHALHPEIMGDGAGCTRVYVSVSSRIYGGDGGIVLNKRGLRLVRRILRDSQFRGTGAAETIGMWPAVTHGEERYLAPCKRYADVLVNSIHIYEPCVFAARVLPLLEGIPGDSPAAGVAWRLANALRRFEPVPEALVPEDSLLREFLGYRQPPKTHAEHFFGADAP
jgi:uridine kinase